MKPTALNINYRGDIMENREQAESDFNFFYEGSDWVERHLEKVVIAILAVAFMVVMALKP